jgi:hypothetical protein
VRDETAPRRTNFHKDGTMNFLRRCSPYLIPFSFLLSAMVGVLGWTLYPARSGWLMVPAVYFLMLTIDLLNRGWVRADREDAFRQTQFAMRMFATATALVGAVSMLGAIAMGEDLLDKAWASSMRNTTGLVGPLVLIVMGNFIPKLPSPWAHAEEPFDWQGVHRFAGMVMMLAGLICLAGRVLLPIEDARALVRAVMFTMAILVVGRKWYSLLTWTEKRNSMQS